LLHLGCRTAHVRGCQFFVTATLAVILVKWRVLLGLGCLGPGSGIKHPWAPLHPYLVPRCSAPWNLVFPLISCAVQFTSLTLVPSNAPIQHPLSLASIGPP
jgi:hypothetical protein